jgi:anti-sigma28 factor (negative regulator of flagellin synthesis)
MVWSNNSSLSMGLNPGAIEPRPTQNYGRVAQDHSAENSALDPDWATLSTAGSQAAQTTDENAVREGKVAEVRAALTAGTYAIPAALVASSAIGSMLGMGA